MVYNKEIIVSLVVALYTFCLFYYRRSPWASYHKMIFDFVVAFLVGLALSLLGGDWFYVPLALLVIFALFITANSIVEKAPVQAFPAVHWAVKGVMIYFFFRFGEMLDNSLVQGAIVFFVLYERCYFFYRRRRIEASLGADTQG